MSVTPEQQSEHGQLESTLSNVGFKLYAGSIVTYFALREGYFNVKGKALDSFDGWLDRKLENAQARLAELEATQEHRAI